jgi:hypothetical protein
MMTCTSLLRLALDTNGCCSASDSPKGTNIIISFEQQRLERLSASTMFNHHPWMEDNVMLCHCDGVFKDTVLHSKAHIVPTYFAHAFSQSKLSHLCLSLVVKLVQHVSIFLLESIKTGPDVIVVVLHTREARFVAWETKALRLGLARTETSLVLAKTDYVRIANSINVDFFQQGPLQRETQRTSKKCCLKGRLKSIRISTARSGGEVANR